MGGEALVVLMFLRWSVEQPSQLSAGSAAQALSRLAEPRIWDGRCLQAARMVNPDGGSPRSDVRSEELLRRTETAAAAGGVTTTISLKLKAGLKMGPEEDFKKYSIP